MTEHDVKTTSADLTLAELAALDRAARRLRSRAAVAAAGAVAAWFRGLTAGAAAPKAGRTA